MDRKAGRNNFREVKFEILGELFMWAFEYRSKNYRKMSRLEI